MYSIYMDIDKLQALVYVLADTVDQLLAQLDWKLTHDSDQSRYELAEVRTRVRGVRDELSRTAPPTTTR